MYINQKAVLSLFIASTSVKAFIPSSSSFMQNVKAPSTSVGFNTGLYSVVESKSDTDTKVLKDEAATVEEKAWKILKEEGSTNTTAAVEDVKPKAIAPKNSTEVVEKLEEAVVKAEVKEVETVEKVTILDEMDLVLAIEEEADALVDEMMDDTCEIDEEGNPADDICVDESKLAMAKSKLKSVVKKTIGLVRTGGDGKSVDSSDVFGEGGIDFNDGMVPEGELLEQGWEQRGNSSAIRRNAEVWKFALSCVFKALKPKKLRKKGASEEEIKAAKSEAAIFIRNGLLKLGPSFVKLVSSCLNSAHKCILKNFYLQCISIYDYKSRTQCMVFS